MDHQTFSLAATTRTVTGKRVYNLRNDGFVPAVVYGHGQANATIQINAAEFGKVYAQAGRGSLIQLSIDQQTPLPVVIQELTRDTMTDHYEHVDFYAVRMDEEVTTQAILVFTGEAPAVKALGGTFVKNKDHVTIKCLPSKLIKEITVDITKLAALNDSVKVADLPIPEGVKVVDQPDEMVALVAPPRSDEELASLNTTVTEDVTKVEGVVKETPEVAADEKATDDKKTSASGADKK